MSKLNQTVSSWRARAAAFWSARTEQERRFLTVGGIFLGLALVYALLVDPALTERERLRKELPELRQEAATLQALATQAAQLAALPPVQVQPLTREALTASLGAAGLTPQSLVMTGEYVKLEFAGAQFASLATWLDTAAREQRLVVQDAKFSLAAKVDNPAGYADATVTLRQQVSP